MSTYVRCFFGFRELIPIHFWGKPEGLQIANRLPSRGPGKANGGDKFSSFSQEQRRFYTDPASKPIEALSRPWWILFLQNIKTMDFNFYPCNCLRLCNPILSS